MKTVSKPTCGCGCGVIARLYICVDEHGKNILLCDRCMVAYVSDKWRTKE